jgi:uncharacterized membrane protein YbhN (UPF0104 family)
MKYKGIIKITISICLLIVLVRTVEVEAFTEVVRTLSPKMVLLVVLGYIVGQVISVIKWWLIVTSQGVSNLSLARTFHAYFTGMFVNVLGVGTVGGDMTRAILISNEHLTKTRCLSSVVADRAHGLVILSLIGTCAVALVGGTALPDQLWTLLTVGGLLVIGCWFVGPATLLRLVSEEHPLRIKVEQFAAAFPQEPTRILLITALSMAFHLLQIGLHMVMAISLGVEVSWSAMLVSIPFVNILSSLPISWQGLGVRENSYAFFLVPGIMSSEQALAMGAIWLFAVTISGLVGGLVSLIPIKTSGSPSGGSLGATSNGSNPCASSDKICADQVRAGKIFKEESLGQGTTTPGELENVA